MLNSPLLVRKNEANLPVLRAAHHKAVFKEKSRREVLGQYSTCFGYHFLYISQDILVISQDILYIHR
jgi:hypothetical protein